MVMLKFCVNLNDEVGGMYTLPSFLLRQWLVNSYRQTNVYIYCWSNDCYGLVVPEFWRLDVPDGIYFIVMMDQELGHYFASIWILSASRICTSKACLCHSFWSNCFHFHNLRCISIALFRRREEFILHCPTCLSMSLRCIVIEAIERL